MKLQQIWVCFLLLNMLVGSWLRRQFDATLPGERWVVLVLRPLGLRVEASTEI
jgi:hypothetical protein